MASSFVNNSNLVQQALADRTALNSYQDLMNTVGSTIGNLANVGASAFQNNKIMKALKSGQQQQQAQGGTQQQAMASNGFNPSFGGIGSNLGFKQASNDGVSPTNDVVDINQATQQQNNGLDYQAGIEQAIKYGRWDIADKLGKAKQNEQQNIASQQNSNFENQKYQNALQQQDVENSFKEKQLAQEKSIALQKLQKGEQLTPTDLYHIEQMKYNKEQMENLKFDRFERTTSGKELAKTRNDATAFQNTSQALKQRIAELDLGDETNSTIGRSIDKLASRFGIETKGSLKLDDLRSLNAQIMSEMRKTLRGQGQITEAEAAALPNIFIFTSDGRIKNNIKNFQKYLDSTEQNRINVYNDYYKNNLSRIQNQNLTDYYEPMKNKNENQYAPKEFTLKRNKATGQTYKVYSDGSYELQQ
jgi:hypothetical protein